MAAAHGRMIHAGMQETAAGEGSAAAVAVTETAIVIMTTIMIMTVAEMIPDLNRDLMQDRLAAEKRAAVKRRTTDLSGHSLMRNALIRCLTKVCVNDTLRFRYCDTQ